ncbi:hypothetical protein B5M45_14260 [Mycobacterium simiae]|uniref:Uncharacterized protein n=1 Tax=Mycobacterium simiae TaxID=1784 RepID=A0A1X0Y4N2_MYCSI|nr:hypothetical protein B5M45_14260 [Mycobacterium simiae]
MAAGAWFRTGRPGVPPKPGAPPRPGAPPKPGTPPRPGAPPRPCNPNGIWPLASEAIIPGHCD